MTYLYVDDSGCSGVSDVGPTPEDIAAVGNGCLDVFKVSGDELVQLSDTGDKWVAPDKAEVDTDDDGSEYHYIP